MYGNGGMNAMKYKKSQYNVSVPTGEGSFILHNTLSGAVADVKEQEFRTIEKILGDPNPATEDLSREEIGIFESLKMGRYIIPIKDNELSILKLRNLVSRFSMSHLELEIIPTLLCNFACVYCYETRKTKIMSKETQHHLVKWISKEITHLDSFHVSWFGGEPLIAFDVMRNLSRQFIDLCSANNTKYTASMPTNGSLLDEKIASQLTEMNFNHVQFTLDGDEDFHNKMRPGKDGGMTFRKILNNIINFVHMETGIPISLRVNFNSESIDSVPGLFEKIPEDVRPKLKIYFRPIFAPPEDWKRKTTICGRAACSYKKENSEFASPRSSSDPVSKTAKKITELNQMALEKGFKITGNSQLSLNPPYYCQVDLYNHFVITPDGSFFKCPVEFELGDRVGYFDADGDLKLNVPGIARWSDKDTFEDEECRGCILLPLCMGGCQFHIINGKKQCPTQRYDFENRLKLVYRQHKNNRTTKMSY